MPRRLLLLTTVVPLLVGALAAGPPTSAAAPHAATHAGHHAKAAKGAPGTWTRISKTTVGIIARASLYRTADKNLHVVYERDVSDGGRVSYATITPSGALLNQGDVLSTGWSTMDSAPVVMGAPFGGLRVVFGGIRTLASGFWSDGRMYDATADAAGTTWTLPADAVGISHSAYGSYGTSGTALADGTPVAAFPLNSDLTWHVGTGSDPDSTYTWPKCCVYNTTMVRDGSNVWLSWYSNGGTTATEGVFVKQIYPVQGPTLKAPGSSMGVNALEDGRTALAARAGGGVFMAYCVGYPSCTKVRLWHVGTTRTVDIPAPFSEDITLSAAPSGRLWVAWSNNIPTMHAARTGPTGLKVGAVVKVGMPKGKAAVYSAAIDGGTGRGDIVINVGDAFWHTQVLAGLTLKASPSTWHHGAAKNVTFTVTDAGDSISGAHVSVAGHSCTTTAAGTCHITFPGSTHAGRLTATATKSGFAKATAQLRIT